MPLRVPSFPVPGSGPQSARSRVIHSSPGHFYSPARLRPIPKIVVACFLLFVATIPFEAANVGPLAGSFSLAKLSGLAFLVCFFFYFNPLSGKRGFPPVPAAMVCFLGYLAVYAMNGLSIRDDLGRPFLNLWATLLQLLVVFWVSSSLLRNEKLARAALLTFTGASLLLATAMLLRLPGFATILATRSGERLTSLDYNPNVLATIMALSAIMLIGLRFGMLAQSGWKKRLLVALMLPPLGVIVQTGSRAGLLASVLGFSVLLFSQQRAARVGKGGIIFLSLLGIGALAYLAASSPMARTRIEDLYQGQSSGRQKIHQAALEMVYQKPLLGWQPVAFWQELGRRVGNFAGTRDAHNLFLHLLLEVGIVGAAPFLLGLWLCVRAAWKARFGALGILPLALLIAVLSANLSHTFLTRKPFWLVLALCLAAYESSRRPGPINSAAASRLLHQSGELPYRGVSRGEWFRPLGQSRGGFLPSSR